MRTGKLFDMSQVEAAAEFIVKELMTMLDRYNIDSLMNRRLETCPAYSHGLISDGDEGSA
jgi:hypothetical protein